VVTRRVSQDPVLGRVAANSAWLLGSNGVVVAASFAQGIILARTLGASRYGVLALVIGLVAVVQQLLDSRIWEAAIKFVVEFRTKGDPVGAAAVVKLCYLVDALVGVAAGAVLIWTADWTARLFVGGEGAADAIRLYAVSTVVAIPVATSTALLRVANRFRWLAYQTAAEMVVRLGAVAAVVVLVGARIVPVLWAYLLAAAVGTAVLAILAAAASRELGLPPWGHAPLRVLREDLRRILGFVAYSNLSGTSRLVTARADVLVLGLFAGTRSVGLYRLARTVSDPLAGLFNSIYQAVYPEMSRMVHERDFDRVRGLSERMKRMIATLVIPACIVVTLTAGWVVPWVFGAGFSGAVPLVRIMVWQLVWTPYLWLPGLLLAMGRARLVAAVNGLDALDYMLLLFLLVPAFGATGAAFATLLRFVAWTAMAVVLERRVVREMELMAA